MCTTQHSIQRGRLHGESGTSSVYGNPLKSSPIDTLDGHWGLPTSLIIEAHHTQPFGIANLVRLRESQADLGAAGQQAVGRSVGDCILGDVLQGPQDGMGMVFALYRFTVLPLKHPTFKALLCSEFPLK